MRPPDDTPLDDLGLCLRACNMLRLTGVRTARNLLALTDAQVLAAPNFGGRRHLLEMKQRLAELGYLDPEAVRREWEAFWSEPL